MAKKYTIYGDYGFTSQTTLHEDTDLAAAIRWAKGYVSSEDAGGYDIIEVAWFSETGEYVTEFTWRRGNQ